jgi:hypothetical protein
MTQTEEYESFVDDWGGRTRFYELVEKCLHSADNPFAQALRALVERNVLAKAKVAEIVRVVSASASDKFGDVVQTPFQGTPETHGQSTDDDFFKAKSERYLSKAESMHALDEAALNHEEGWPDADKDIGAA